MRTSPSARLGGKRSRFAGVVVVLAVLAVLAQPLVAQGVATPGAARATTTPVAPKPAAPTPAATCKPAQATGRVVFGRITRSDATAVAGAKVSIFPGAAADAALPAIATGVSDATGCYAIAKGLADGATYRIGVTSPATGPDAGFVEPRFYPAAGGFATAAVVSCVDTCTVPAHGSVATAAPPFDVKLVSTGSIHGTVRRADPGTPPLTRARVFLLRSDGRRAGPFVTDGNGRYRADRLPAGSWTLFFVGRLGYGDEYYADRATLALADPVSVTVRHTTTIDAVLSKGAGAATSSPASPSAPPAPAAAGGPAADAAPSIRLLTLTNATFAVDPKHVPRGVPRGTAFVFSLSKPSSVRITIDRLVAGRQVNGRCRRVTNANRSSSQCIVHVAVRGFTVKVAGSTARVSFLGYAGGKKGKKGLLAAGRYGAKLVATDRAGKHSRAKHVSFRVITR